MARKQFRSSSLSNLFVGQVADAMQALGATGQLVAAAVSGGADSTSLLLSLYEMHRLKRIELAAMHANHELRGGESEGDEQFVRQLCDRLHIPLICRRLPVCSKAAERGEGIEATARQLRQQMFVEAAVELHAKYVATAHTADDQVETVLHRIVRGTSLAGLAGIPLRRNLAGGVTLIRPLLQLRRSDVISFLAAIGQPFREDRTNRDLEFTRNRIRHELLPYLEKQFNPQVSEAVLRLSTLAGEYQAAMDDQVRRLLDRAVVKAGRNFVRVRPAALRKLPRVVVRECFRSLWADQAWPLQELGQQDLERLAELALAGSASQSCHLPGGVRAKRSRDHLVLERESTDASGK